MCVLALLVFAGSAVAHSAGSVAMASEMIVTASGMTGMDDCDACSDPEAGFKGAVCDFVCNATGFAAVPVISTDAIHVAASDAHVKLPERAARSFSAPPAEEPPRF